MDPRCDSGPHRKKRADRVPKNPEVRNKKEKDFPKGPKRKLNGPREAPTMFSPIDKSYFDRYIVLFQKLINQALKSRKPVKYHQASLVLVGRSFEGKSHFQKVVKGSRTNPNESISLYDIPNLEHQFIENRDDIIREVTEEVLTKMSERSSSISDGQELSLSHCEGSIDLQDYTSMSYFSGICQDIDSSLDYQILGYEHQTDRHFILTGECGIEHSTGLQNRSKDFSRVEDIFSLHPKDNQTHIRESPLVKRLPVRPEQIEIIHKQTKKRHEAIPMPF